MEKGKPDGSCLHYRSEHPNCKFCRYIKIDYGYYGEEWFCKVKDKTVIGGWFSPLFCKYYDVDDTKCILD